MPNSTVLFFFDLEPRKALEQFGELFLTRHADAVQEVAYRFVHDAVLVEFDAVILIQGQIAGETLDEPVGETVQGHHRHLSVAMEHGRPEGACTRGENLRGQRGLVCEFFDERVRRLAAAHFGQIRQNALLHLPCRLVGEGQGQNVTKRPWVVVRQTTRQIPAHEPVRLAASRRGADDFKGLL